MDEPIRADELDIHGDLWGIRFVDGCSNSCAELYVEDDEWWHLKVTFDKVWLSDLAKVVAGAISAQRADGSAEVTLKRKEYSTHKS